MELMIQERLTETRLKAKEKTIEKWQIIWREHTDMSA